MIQGGTYFFTVVTYHRLQILTDEKARPILKNAWLDVIKRFPFTQVAVCLLPEHIHCVWTLPEGESELFGALEGDQKIFHPRISKGIWRIGYSG